MNSAVETHYSPISTSVKYKARLKDNVCRVSSDLDQVLEAQIELSGNLLTIQGPSTSPEEDTFLRSIMIEYLLGQFNHVCEIHLKDGFTLSAPFKSLGHHFLRSEFFQLPALWHHNQNYLFTPERWTKTGEVSHPIRPKSVPGQLYRRYVPQIGKTISFRLMEMSDLDTFHQWHNQTRVAFFWELDKSKEELKAYMEKSLQDPHQIPMIVEIDAVPVGYFEMYWAREDRLGPYYESEAFDRGFHFLVGNQNFLGYPTTDSIIKSCLHFLYLDDARTRRVMAEPRHDNEKVLKYAEESIGWKKVKIFDFPHKRSWLLENSRELFFGGNSL